MADHDPFEYEQEETLEPVADLAQHPEPEPEAEPEAAAENSGPAVAVAEEAVLEAETKHWYIIHT